MLNKKPEEYTVAALQYLSNVVTLALDDSKCCGCAMCATVCPHGVFAIRDDTAVIMDRDACIECGACAMNCPTEAISVESGVGCAAAIIQGALTGSAPECGCSDDKPCCG